MKTTITIMMIMVIIMLISSISAPTATAMAAHDLGLNFDFNSWIVVVYFKCCC